MSAEELRAKIREVPDFPKPGILFYDITTLLKDADAYKEAIDLMLAPYADEQVDVVVGMESRGFIFSAPMAYQLGAGLVPVRKLGKLPAETITVEYALEYGSNTLEIHRDAIAPGQKVLIVDDLLATGGTVHGTIELVERLKGEVVGLGVPGRARVPQGPRPARRTARHERRQVLTGHRIEAGTLADSPSDRSDVSQPPQAAAGDAVGPAGDPKLPAATTPAATPPAAVPPPVDLGRRRFFRSFAGELLNTAAIGGGRGAGPPAGLGRGRRRDPQPGRLRGRAAADWTIRAPTSATAVRAASGRRSARTAASST